MARTTLAASPTTRRRMRAQARRDTRPELAIRKHLFACGYRYRSSRPQIEGLRCRPDFIFPRERVAVFVNGCFWHVCPEHATWPTNNAAWWRAKLEGNQARDQRIDASLRELGWEPIRLWEHEATEAAAEKVIAVLVRKRGEQGR